MHMRTEPDKEILRVNLYLHPDVPCECESLLCHKESACNQEARYQVRIHGHKQVLCPDCVKKSELVLSVVT